MKIEEFFHLCRTTRMCFVAGTLVLTAEGLQAIETIEPDTLVMARDESTGEQGWKPVLDTITTHPDELFTLSIDTDGDGEADEEFEGTGEHPFWVEGREEFVPMAELRPGMRLSRAREGGTAIVLGNMSKRGPPGEIFTTYNIEVAGFHTYFVGESGVWVHNTGTPCERVFAIFHKFMLRHKDDVWRSYESTRKRISEFTDSEVLRLKLFNEARIAHFNQASSSGLSPTWRNIGIQARPAGVPGSSARLGGNLEKTMGIKKPKNMASHHIVEKADNPLVRDVLERAGIHIDESANGVWLKRDAMTQSYARQGRSDWLDGIGPRHEGVHSQTYSDAIAARIQPLDGMSADIIRDELQKIAKELVEGTFPWP